MAQSPPVPSLTSATGRTVCAAQGERSLAKWLIPLFATLVSETRAAVTQGKEWAPNAAAGSAKA